MSFGWVAGAVRGRALARRRLGDEGVQALASQPSFGRGLGFLMASSYGHRVRTDFDIVAAQRAVAETSLWHLRVLAGWLPPAGVQTLRAIAGWFELLNLESRASMLAAGEPWDEVPFPLGALATIWSRAAGATSLRELRVVLAHSAWGDPGGETLADIFVGLRIGWSRALATVSPAARAWCDGGIALAIGKALFIGSAAPVAVQHARVPELGNKWHAAAGIGEFARTLPASARWVLRDVRKPADLWQAERLWWERVDADAAELLRHSRLGRSAVIGAGALLVTDCWRAQAALETAARRSAVEEEVHADA